MSDEFILLNDTQSSVRCEGSIPAKNGAHDVLRFTGHGDLSSKYLPDYVSGMIELRASEGGAIFFIDTKFFHSWMRMGDIGIELFRKSPHMLSIKGDCGTLVQSLSFTMLLHDHLFTFPQNSQLNIYIDGSHLDAETVTGFITAARKLPVDKRIVLTNCSHLHFGFKELRTICTMPDTRGIATDIEINGASCQLDARTIDSLIHIPEGLRIGNTEPSRGDGTDIARIVTEMRQREQELELQRRPTAAEFTQRGDLAERSFAARAAENSYVGRG